jgi:hypothetical protein
MDSTSFELGQLDASFDGHDTRMIRSRSCQSDQPRRKESNFSATCSLVVIVILAALAAMAVIGSNSGHPSLAQNKKSHIAETCGLSATEAQELGCVFDAVLLGWVPWRCYDPALAREVQERKEWEMFRDPDLASLRVTMEELMGGEWQTMYVSRELYIIHCMYTWRKARDAARNGEVLDGYLADDHQTNHCEMMLLRPAKLNATGIELYTKFVSCPWAHTNDGRLGWYRVLGGKRIHRLL